MQQGKDASSPQSVEAGQIISLYEDFQREASGADIKKIRELKTALLQQIADGADGAATKDLPVYAPEGYGFADTVVRYVAEKEGTYHKNTTWAKARVVRPMTFKERAENILKHGVSMTLCGASLGMSGFWAYEGIDRLLNSASQNALLSGITIAAIAMLAYIGKDVVSNYKAFRSALSENAIVDALPESANGVKEGHMTGSGLRDKLSRSRLSYAFVDGVKNTQKENTARSSANAGGAQTGPRMA